MKLWIATDEASDESILYTRRPESFRDDAGLLIWEAVGGDVASLYDIRQALGELPPPGECWEFDVELRRVM